MKRIKKEKIKTRYQKTLKVSSMLTATTKKSINAVNAKYNNYFNIIFHCEIIINCH